MNTNQLIAIKSIFKNYNLDVVLVDKINEFDLVPIQYEEPEHYIEESQLNKLEQILRMHTELQINMEGIDVILNLLDKLEILNQEIVAMRKKIALYE